MLTLSLWLPQSSSSLSFPPEPKTYQEAMVSPEAALWRKAAEAEMLALIANKTFTIVGLPSGRKPVKDIWVFKRKLNTDGTVNRYKARVCAKGYTQQKGKDYFDTFAPVARTTSMRVILAITAHEGLELKSIDIDNAFLNSVIDVDIYMTQLEGFVDPRYLDVKK